MPTVVPSRLLVHRGAGLSSHPTASIIVLVMNDTSLLALCLESLEAHVPCREAYELIVVANGTPGPPLAAIRARSNILLLESPINRGFAGGCNLASGFARADRLVFLNDDVEVFPGWLEGLHRALDADSTTAVAGSRVLLSDGRLQEAGSVLWRDGSTSGVGRGSSPEGSEFSARRPVDYVSFCSAMVRRDAWQQAGGFDERYFPAYYEDVDLCATIRQLGWSVVYEPTSQVRHAEGASASRGFRDFVSRRNRALFVAKWVDGLSDYQPRPGRQAQRDRAVAAAVARTAERTSRVLPTVPSMPTDQPAALAVTARGADDGDGLLTDVRLLDAALSVWMAYATELERQLSSLTLADVLRRLLSPTKARMSAVGASLRRRRRVRPR